MFIGRGDNTSILGSPDHLKADKSGEEKAKEKAKVESKELEEHSLAKSRTLNCGQKMIVLGGPKEQESRKVFRKVMKAFGKVGFRAYPPERGSSNNFNPHKGRGKDQKGKGREGAFWRKGIKLKFFIVFALFSCFRSFL